MCLGSSINKKRPEISAAGTEDESFMVKTPENKPNPLGGHEEQEDVPIKEGGQKTSQKDLVFDTGT